MTTHEKIEQPFLERILYIGNKIPESLVEDKRDKFILLGVPQDLINEVQTLINQARKEAAIEELERLKHFDSFNEPYTWQGDERPGKLVDIRIKALKEGKQ